MVSNMDAALSPDQIQWLAAFIKTVTRSPVIYTGMSQVYDVSHAHHTMRLFTQPSSLNPRATATCSLQPCVTLLRGYGCV